MVTLKSEEAIGLWASRKLLKTLAVLPVVLVVGVQMIVSRNRKCCGRDWEASEQEFHADLPGWGSDASCTSRRQEYEMLQQCFQAPRRLER